MTLNDLGLTVEYLKCENYTNFSKRTFRLTDTESSKSREVIQFHYTSWPDFYVSSSPVAFLQFLKKVRDSGALNSDVGQAVVHCSAGIGRSGTFCLVDSCLVLVEKDGENKISVPDLLLKLRQSRMGLIQTADQLYFSYQAIIEGIKHFNDPTFGDYDEVPKIDNEDYSTETDPPRPPPRCTSILQSQHKPLPTVPTNDNDHVSVNNNNNSENGDGTRSERPLPPLPDESPDDSDSEDIEDDSDEDMSDEQDVDLDDDDNDDDDDDGVDDDEQATTEQTTKLLNGTSSNGSNECEDSFNPDATLPPSPTKMSTTSLTEFNNSNSSLETPSSPENDSGLASTAELRRRKRKERNADIEAKIKDIKRKQKETEAAAEAAPKKRRCLMIFSGVVVCVICCAYVYSKLG